MKLFFTGPEFVLNGASRPEIPFLVDDEMELVSAPNQYLRYIATVKGRILRPGRGRHFRLLAASKNRGTSSGSCEKSQSISKMNS